MLGKVKSKVYGYTGTHMPYRITQCYLRPDSSMFVMQMLKGGCSGDTIKAGDFRKDVICAVCNL